MAGWHEFAAGRLLLRFLLAALGSVGQVPAPENWQVRTRPTEPGLHYFFFFLRGTLAPFLRASESPMAMACFRLWTLFFDLPLFSFPRLNLCIALLTVFCDFFPYFLAICSSTAPDLGPRSHRTRCKRQQSL